MRNPPPSLGLFETVLNAGHRHAPGARIAFNTRPDDSDVAAARWVGRYGLFGAGLRQELKRLIPPSSWRSSLYSLQPGCTHRLYICNRRFCLKLYSFLFARAID